MSDEWVDITEWVDRERMLAERADLPATVTLALDNSEGRFEMRRVLFEGPVEEWGTGKPMGRVRITMPDAEEP